MAITVFENGDRTTTYPKAVKWYVDESGRLHVIGESGNVASYNSAAWANVAVVEGRA